MLFFFFLFILPLTCDYSFVAIVATAAAAVDAFIVGFRRIKNKKKIDWNTSILLWTHDRAASVHRHTALQYHSGILICCWWITIEVHIANDRLLSSLRTQHAIVDSDFRIASGLYSRLNFVSDLCKPMRIAGKSSVAN